MPSMPGKEERKITGSRVRVPGVGGPRLEALEKVLAKTRAFTVRKRGTVQINVQRSYGTEADHPSLVVLLSKGKTEEEDSEVRTKARRVVQ